ncbi:MAG: hypothetical protein KGI59_03510 [Patescibacteria group bacterium]|nr:hypothetical protein [Patescibacteria group bacterium]MDE2172401.1 hypothetical protein [Patescibacteria group bacterium]
MSKRQILMIMGIWVAIFLILGFPSSWDKVFAVISGLLIAGISYSMAPKVTVPSGRDLPFSEHRSPGITNSPTQAQK